jgi:hypothetical protein
MMRTDRDGHAGSVRSATAGLLVLVGVLSLALACGKSKEEPPRKPRQAAVLSSASGTVSFRSREGRDWHPATGGYTLVTGDALASGPGARMEVQTRAPSSVLRADERTTFVLNQSDSGGVRAAAPHLVSGGLWANVRGLAEDETFRFTGPFEVRFLKPSVVRMTSTENGESGVSVYEGEVRILYRPDHGAEPAYFQLGKSQSLLKRPGAPPEVSPLPLEDPWRNGWRSQKAAQVEEDLPPDPVRRIDEKPRRGSR